jgi:hypothetical protein
MDIWKVEKIKRQGKRKTEECRDVAKEEERGGQWKGGKTCSDRKIKRWRKRKV